MQRDSAFLCVLGLMASAVSLAQTLPPPSRTVFKCEVAGRVVYSDAPCLGAKRVNVEPTQGLNKLSGTERIGTDVQRERLNKQIAEAYKPIFGETAEQRAKRHRRARLSPEVRKKCAQLDTEVAIGERDEAMAKGKALFSVQGRLLRLRTEYQTLKC